MHRTAATAFALLALAAPAWAGAPEVDPQAAYADKWAEVTSAIADQHYDVGAWLTQQDMHAWANEEYNRAIFWNPQHERARQRLGFALQAGEWQRDPSIEVLGTNEKRDDDALRVARNYSERWERASRSIARECWELAQLCERNNLTEERTRALQMTVDYDPNNRNARRALGFEQDRNRGNIWVTEEVGSILNHMRSDLAAQPGGDESTTQTEVEQRLSATHQKRQSPHFLFESPHLTQDQLQTLIRYAEQTQTSYRALFRLDAELIQNPVNFIVFDTQAQHRNFVDQFDSDRDPRSLDLARNSSGLMSPQQPETWMGPRSMEDMQDHVCHATAQSCIAFHTQGDHAWLTEGLAFFFSRAINGTIRTHCTNLTETRGQSNHDFGNPDGWATEIKQMVLERSDPPVEEVLNVDIANLISSRSAKAWSLVDWLIFEHRDKFAEFMNALVRDPQDHGQNAFQEVFGWSVQDLDEKWRNYVRFTYPG